MKQTDEYSKEPGSRAGVCGHKKAEDSNEGGDECGDDDALPVFHTPPPQFQDIGDVQIIIDFIPLAWSIQEVPVTIQDKRTGICPVFRIQPDVNFKPIMCPGTEL